MKQKTIFYYLIIVGTFIISSCNSSVKGKWSESEKQEFRQDMDAVEELSIFGENKYEWIECYLKKCEANYPSYKDSNKDEKGTEKLGLECVKEVLNNFKKVE